MEKREIHCHEILFSWNQFTVKFFNKSLIWRKINEKTVAIKFRNFRSVAQHTLQKFTLICISQIIREFNAFSNRLHYMMLSRNFSFLVSEKSTLIFPLQCLNNVGKVFVPLLSNHMKSHFLTQSIQVTEFVPTRIANWYVFHSIDVQWHMMEGSFAYYLLNSLYNYWQIDLFTYRRRFSCSQMPMLRPLIPAT